MKQLNKGFTLLEVIIGLALAAIILQAAYYLYSRMADFWKPRQAELVSLENALFFFEKLSHEARFSSQILNTTSRPTDDFHFSFVDGLGREITYYLEDTIIKRKLDSTQPLTEDTVFLNSKLSPPEPVFYWNGKLLKVVLYLQNKNKIPLRLVSQVVI